MIFAIPNLCSMLRLANCCLCVYVQRLRENMCDHLLEEALVDLQDHFNSLLTQHWLQYTDSLDTICLTLSDYFNDYSHLHQK